MQAVILAGGRGKRMKELTDTVPKPLLFVGEKSLLQHKIDALPDCIDEVIIVVGYQKEKIIESLGDVYGNKKITYVHMDTLNGTAPALFLCKDLITDKVLVLMGDDLYGKDDMARATLHDWMIGVQSASSSFAGGRIYSQDGKLQDVLEEGGDAGDYINTGMYVVGPELFRYEMVQIPSGEFGLPQTLALAAQDINVATVEVETWIRITSPEDLQQAEKDLIQ